jgi:hypothetical protein
MGNIARNRYRKNNLMETDEAHCPLVAVSGPDSKLIMYDGVTLVRGLGRPKIYGHSVWMSILKPSCQFRKCLFLLFNIAFLCGGEIGKPLFEQGFFYGVYANEK